MFGKLLGKIAGTDVSPNLRNFEAELGQNVLAQQKAMPLFTAAESAWRPEMIDINLRGLNQGIVKGLPIAQRAISGISQATGQAGMDALNRFGMGFAQKQRDMNPELYGTLGRLSQDYASSGISPLMQKLQQFAQARDIGQLSQQDVRSSQQGAREAFGARGMLLSNPAIAQEILGRDEYRRQREREDIGMISGVEGMRSQQEELNRRFGLGVGQLGLGSMIRPEQVPGFAASQAFTPGSLMGMAQSFNQRVIDPTSAYGQSVHAGNVQSMMDAKTATAGNRAGIIKGMMSAGASYFG